MSHKSAIVAKYGGNNVAFESEPITNTRAPAWKSKLIVHGKCIFESVNEASSKRIAENEMAKQFLEKKEKKDDDEETVRIVPRPIEEKRPDNWEEQAKLNTVLAHHISDLYRQIGELREKIDALEKK